MFIVKMNKLCKAVIRPALHHVIELYFAKMLRFGVVQSFCEWDVCAGSFKEKMPEKTVAALKNN
jgi:hypothetical protein